MRNPDVILAGGFEISESLYFFEQIILNNIKKAGLFNKTEILM